MITREQIEEIQTESRENGVSTKVVRIIQSYVGMVNKMAWRKF